MSDPAAKTLVATKIVRVTVFEDRADVVRTGEVTLSPGGSLLIVCDLPAVLSDHHVVARLEPLEPGAAVHAHVNDVRIDRRVIGGDDDLAARRAAQHEELEKIDEEVRAAGEDLQQCEASVAASESALRRWAHGASLAAGRGHAGKDAWSAGFAAFEADLDAVHAQRTSARAALAVVKRRRAHAAEVRGGKPTGQRTVAQLSLRVSVQAAAPARMKLIVSTLVPCAAWRPTHEARLLAAPAVGSARAAEHVRFTTYGAVWNRTGESWHGVELVLSTARPSAGAVLPPLRADRLSLRTKTAEERKTIVVEHRQESVPKSAVEGTAPGVDDGGEARTFRVARASVPDDGRPHRVELGEFQAPCTTARVAYPELVPQVFLRASLKNPGPSPILAGAVTLVIEIDGDATPSNSSCMWVGTGDVLYVGAGESFDLSFGSDDRFVVRTSTRRVDDKKLVGKDIVHFVREAVLSQSGAAAERVLVHLRLPVSELKQLRVLPSPHHGNDDTKPDEHGVVRIPIDLPPGVERKVALAFSFDTSGDVRIPDPW